MKMLTIVCREKFEDEVLVIFSTLKITGYTVVHGVGGSGETGAVSVTHTAHDRNKLILVALDDERMDILVKAVKQAQARLVEEHLGHPVRSRPSSSLANRSCNERRTVGLVYQGGKFCSEGGYVVLDQLTFLLGEIGRRDMNPKKRFACRHKCVDVSAVRTHDAAAFLRQSRRSNIPGGRRQ